jgi:Ca2+-binding EF-hand superfamily protein
MTYACHSRAQFCFFRILVIDYLVNYQAIFYWTLVVRHLSRWFEKNPELKPKPTPLNGALDTANYKQTGLSKAQADQIREIFELFDTDGGGCIDQQELQFAMTALGFQTKDSDHQRNRKHKEALEVMDTLIDDGKVTLEEFSALMTGEMGSQDPYEEARIAFSVLSRPDEDRTCDGLITLKKLEAVCLEYAVRFIVLTSCYGSLCPPALPCSPCQCLPALPASLPASLLPSLHLTLSPFFLSIRLSPHPFIHPSAFRFAPQAPLRF